MPTQILFPAGSPSGVPVAQPVYLVDIFGNPISSTNGQGVNVLNANPNGQSTMANSAPVAIASDQTAVPSKPSNLEVAGQAAESVTGTSTPIILAMDVSGYRSFSFQMTGTWSMTLQIQFCNDNTNWTQAYFHQVSNVAHVTQITTNGQWYGPIQGRYMRIIPTVWNSNASAVGTLELSTLATGDYPGVSAVQSGTWNQLGVGPGVDVTMFASAAQTTTQTGADQTNSSGRGIKVVLDMTNVGTGSVTLEIDGKDVASGKYYAILTGAAVTTNVTNVYTIYPGLTAAANVTASDVLPRTFRIKVTANNANSATYSVGYSFLS